MSDRFLFVPGELLEHGAAEDAVGDVHPGHDRTGGHPAAAAQARPALLRAGHVLAAQLRLPPIRAAAQVGLVTRSAFCPACCFCLLRPGAHGETAPAARAATAARTPLRQPAPSRLAPAARVRPTTCTSTF